MTDLKIILMVAAIALLIAAIYGKLVTERRYESELRRMREQFAQEASALSARLQARRYPHHEAARLLTIARRHMAFPHYIGLPWLVKQQYELGFAALKQARMLATTAPRSGCG